MARPIAYPESSSPPFQGYPPDGGRDRVCRAASGRTFLVTRKPGRRERELVARRTRGTPGAGEVAATLVGTVIGAGFGSGQELMRFFSSYGDRGAAGLCLAVAVLAVAAINVMVLAHRRGATSYHEVLPAVCGRPLARLVDLSVAAMSFGGLAVMFAAAGAIMTQESGWPVWLGGLLMVGLTLATCAHGLGGIARVNAVAVFAMVAVALVICGWTLAAPPPAAQPPAATLREAFQPVAWWPAASVLYVAYNLLLATGVMVPLAGACATRAVARRGAVLACAVLLVTALVSHLALHRSWDQVAGAEVPMAQLAARLGGGAPTIYVIVLWIEVYTTAVAALYGLTVRVTGEGRRAYPAALVLFAALAYAASGAGFSFLVGALYPAFGVAGLWFLFGALTLPLRSARAGPRGGPKDP
jgi:uncharacterized membrane protein YkvI